MNKEISCENHIHSSATKASRPDSASEYSSSQQLAVPAPGELSPTALQAKAEGPPGGATGTGAAAADQKRGCSLSVHPLTTAGQGPTDQEMEAVARARLAELSRSSDDLLAQTHGADAATTEILRSEATRLSSVAFEITRALCHGDAQRAYRISTGGADQDGGGRDEVAA